MKPIVVTTQKEWDALPKAFSKNTMIEIRSSETIVIHSNPGLSRVEAWGSSRVVAQGSSRVVAWDSSHVVAWGLSCVYAQHRSSVSAYEFSVVFVQSEKVEIKELADKVTAKFVYEKTSIENQSKLASIVVGIPSVTFEQYLERGYVVCDGLRLKLLKRKKLKQLEVFECEDFFGKKSFVVKKGDITSHGETLEKAKSDLKYKISSRDTSEFKKWKLSDVKSLDELIRAYRAITGACEFGVKDFCEKTKLKKKYAIRDAIALTEGRFGHEQFSEFFK